MPIMDISILQRFSVSFLFCTFHITSLWLANNRFHSECKLAGDLEQETADGHEGNFLQPRVVQRRAGFFSLYHSAGEQGTWSRLTLGSASPHADSCCQIRWFFAVQRLRVVPRPSRGLPQHQDLSPLPTPVGDSRILLPTSSGHLE